MMCAWLAIPDTIATGNLPVVRALLDMGISRWSDFILLSKEQVNNLSYRS
jgi:hypothetical protein